MRRKLPFFTLFRTSSSTSFLPPRPRVRPRGAVHESREIVQHASNARRDFSTQIRLNVWDHKRVPRVVPRTFLGPLVLGKMTKILARAMELVVNSNPVTKRVFRNEKIWGKMKHLVETVDEEETFVRTKMHYQVIMRMILGCASTLSLHKFHTVIGKNFENDVAVYAAHRVRAVSSGVYA